MSVCVCVCVCMCVGVCVCVCVCACVQTMSRNSSTYHYFILALLFLLSFCPLLLSYPPSVSLLSTFHFSFPLSQVVKPHFVATAMSGIQRTSRFIPDPVTYTRAAVATIGIQHTTYGYFYHALQVRISVAMVTDLLRVNCINTSSHTVCTHMTYPYTLHRIFVGRIFEVVWLQ